MKRRRIFPVLFFDRVDKLPNFSVYLCSAGLGQASPAKDFTRFSIFELWTSRSPKDYAPGTSMSF